MSSLSHHGIKGQKWGVRRYQNKDGTRTALGKMRHEKDTVIKAGSNLNRVTGNEHEVNKGHVYMSIISEDHEIYKQEASGGIQDRETGQLITEIYDTQHTVTKDIRVPSFSNSMKAFEKVMTDQDIDEVAKEVGDAYGSDNERHAQEFKNNYLNRDKASGREDAYYNFVTSLGNSEKNRQLLFNELRAEGYDAIWDENDRYEGWMKTPLIIFDRGEHTNQTSATKLNHTSIGGTMYIEGNALILGDSSYLEHHGIKGQRWGVRRFQNADGSLTNAGRKRLGYATKGAVQTVGKAFKAGVKAGGNAVKAVKAHHEKKEAEKLQKKKEKASQSRLGVLANKDLFTDDELRALNQRFKVEDELKMASIQKGVEIAKAVGTIASNAATAAKAYEDITGQSLSPIKRQAAELKKQQDAEDRARKIAREDAEEARKVAQEERNVKTYEQELRKATASADKEEFLAKKTKAQADQEILKALKGARDFDKPDDDDDDPPKPPNGGGGNPPGGGSDDTGKSWMERATSGGKNVFEQMKYDSDPEYRAAKDAHDEKVARKERMAELDRREKERQAEKAAKDQALVDMINQSNARTGRGQSTPPKQSQPETPEPTKTPRQDSDALFSQKGSLPIDKDRYRNRKAAEKAKKVKEDVAEDRAKKQDEKAVDKTIDDVIAAQRRNTELMRNMDPHAYDRAVAKDYVKNKTKEAIDKIPETLGNLNPINRAAKKIANKVEQEGYENTRKALKKQYEDMAEAQGRDEANYVMYNTRIAGLQGQGYTEQKARQIADSDSTFSAKRSRQREYSQRAVELETARKKTVKKLDQAEKNTVDDYYKKIYLDAYAPGTPKREALDKEYRSTMDKISKLREENQDLYDKSMREAKKILEHSFSIQNGVLFIDESVSLSHHGIKGQRWGVRRFQNADGTLTEAGKKREARQAEKKAKKEAKFHTKAENLRAKDLARYDKMLSKNLTSQDRLNYTELKKYTEKASDKEVLAGSFYAKHSAIGAGIVSAVSLSIVGVPNIASIPVGISIAKSINIQTRDNWRIREINAQNRRKYAEDKTREVASYVEHSALVASISDGLYLEHHGILGQKWGVRRFQDTAGRLTAAGKARLKEAKSSIDSLRPRDKKTTNSNKKVQRRGAGEEEMVASGGASWEELDEEEYAAYLEWFKSLSDEELEKLGIKRSEIDAIKSKEDLYALIQKYRQKKTYNTGTAKLINGTLNALFSSNLLSVFDPAVVMGSAATAELRKKLAEHRKSKEPIDPKSGFHVKSDANASKIDDMKNVNPGFTDLSDNTKNNCMLCTTTYDLRRRGYDVTAEEVRAGYYTGDVKRWYPDAEIHKVKNYSTVDELINNTEKAISKQGDGARGNIMVTWQQGGGHSMAYEVENGKVVIYDCQTGTRYENAGDILKYTNTVSYARLDNVEPDYEKIKEASN